jgi:hypothetical protein
VAAAQDREPCERKNDRADDADDEHRSASVPGCAGDVVGVLVSSIGVVADGEEMALRNGFGGGEFAGMNFVVGEVVVGDAEVLGGGDAESDGTTGTELVLAGDYRGESFGPVGLLGCEFVGGLRIH